MFNNIDKEVDQCKVSFEINILNVLEKFNKQHNASLHLFDLLILV